jgi:hypothetical protein
MSYTLVLNSKNVIGANNNIFSYQFMNGFRIEEGAEICVSSVQVPYSWYNVSYFYQNTKFNLIIPTNATTATLNITIPDGFYTIPQLQSYIEKICLDNNYYLKNSAGNNVFYINLAYNISAYKVQLVCSLVPTTAQLTGLGLTNPAGWVLPTSSRCPQLVVLDTYFGKLIGFNIGTYPTTTTSNFNKVSDYTPLGSTVNSIILRCNLVSNGITMPSDIIDSFAISNVSFGSNIDYQSAYEKWVKLQPGVYQNLSITMQDERFNDILMLDPNSVITLNIRNKK